MGAKDNNLREGERKRDSLYPSIDSSIHLSMNLTN